MKRTRVLTVFLAIALLSAVTLGWANNFAARDSTTTAVSHHSITQLSKLAVTLPLRFEANIGQDDASVLYRAQGSGYSMFFTSQEVVIALANKTAPIAKSGGSPQPAIMRFQLQDANSNPQVTASNELATKSNYFISNDPRKWRTNVPNYARVSYTNVYPGIDLVWYGNAGQMEYDFNVAAGSDPSQIHFKVTGADQVELSGGSLVLHTAAGDLHQPAPHIYQTTANGKQEISGGYMLAADGSVGFSLAAYDHSHPLTIDPTLDYSTYLGGLSTDTGASIAIDSQGAAYITGQTLSGNFPTQNPLQPGLAGGADAWVAKLNADGSALDFATYLGGGGTDGGNGIAVDAAGDVIVAGFTSSTDFPTYNPIQPLYAGGQDVFVAKLSPSGSSLSYATYLGGSGEDSALKLAADPLGRAYVVGWTTSSDYPVHNAIQPNKGGGDYDGFITRINVDGSALDYSTYLGGNARDAATGITVGAQGQAYVLGYTLSTNFTVAGTPYQPSNAGGADAFVAELSEDGSAFIYSTYFGGRGNDYGGYSIAVDSGGDVYVAGQTYSADLPTHNPIQSTLRGSSDIFVAELNPAGSALLYSTYIGGSGEEWDDGIAVDNTGAVYASGWTSSLDFPTQEPIQPAYGGGEHDAFVFKLNASGSAFDYSTYLGGDGTEEAILALGQRGDIYLTGYTSSTNFPTHDPLQRNNAGGLDAFIAKIAESVIPTPLPTPVRTDCGNTFTDIYGNTFYGEILDLYCRGYVSGTGPNTFSPNAPATRAQVARVLIKAFGWPLQVPDGGGHTFTDVPTNNFAFAAIESGYRVGVITGYDRASCISAGAAYPCYLPNHFVSRAQLTALTVRAARYTVITPTNGHQTFSDVPPTSWAYRFVETAAAHHVVNGYSNGSFQPNYDVHRDQMSGIVDRALNNP